MSALARLRTAVESGEVHEIWDATYGDAKAEYEANRCRESLPTGTVVDGFYRLTSRLY